MFPGVDKRQAEQLMKRMGIKSQEIEVEEVIIRAKDKEIVITNPQVSKINMMGQDTFQIIGTVKERAREDAISEEDIKTVMEHANVPKETAMKALENTHGDIAKAIIELQK